jgi:hypothetical protein
MTHFFKLFLLACIVSQLVQADLVDRYDNSWENQDLSVPKPRQRPPIPSANHTCYISGCICTEDRDGRYTIACDYTGRVSYFQPWSLRVSPNATQISISSLTISNFNFDHIPNHALANLTIERLVLDNNKVDRIPANWFAQINGLRTLELYSNRFYKVHHGLFKPLIGTLRSAVFSANQFSIEEYSGWWPVLNSINELVNLESLAIINMNNFASFEYRVSLFSINIRFIS